MNLEERKKIAEAVRLKSVENAKDPNFQREMRRAQEKYGTIKEKDLHKRLTI